ncbi:hypothetical protein EDB85DRAFT_196838 [Lactarius pseudohatsudake]|nr:hypothetical protein EDB85DRAFT_196838 [Lactarius pseudohatsudake]
MSHTFSLSPRSRCESRASQVQLRSPPERYSRDRHQSVLVMLSFGLIPPPQTHARFRLRFERHWQPFARHHHPAILAFADPPYLPFPSHLPASLSKRTMHCFRPRHLTYSIPKQLLLFLASSNRRCWLALAPLALISNTSRCTPSRDRYLGGPGFSRFSLLSISLASFPPPPPNLGSTLPVTGNSYASTVA